MSSKDFIPTAQQKFDSWLLKFQLTCQNNQEELGLDAVSLAKINSLSDTYHQSVSDSYQARMTYKGFNAKKAKDRKAIEEVVRQYARIWKSDPKVSKLVIADLGLQNSSVFGALKVVEGLVASPDGAGSVKLKWSRTGNAPTTVFIVESKFPNQRDWEFLAAVTRTEFVDPRQLPGVPRWYRVTSNRAGKSTVPSRNVGVYVASALEPNPLKLTA